MTEEQIELLKKTFFIGVTGCIFQLLIGITLVYKTIRPLYIKASPSFTSHPPNKDFCYSGFESIISSIKNGDINSNYLDKWLLAPAIYSELSQTNYFEFEGTEKIISVIPSKNKNGCFLTTKDSKGLRTFYIGIEFSDDFEKGHAITLIKEKGVEEV